MLNLTQRAKFSLKHAHRHFMSVNLTNRLTCPFDKKILRTAQILSENPKLFHQ